MEKLIMFYKEVKNTFMYTREEILEKHEDIFQTLEESKTARNQTRIVLLAVLVAIIATFYWAGTTGHWIPVTLSASTVIMWIRDIILLGFKNWISIQKRYYKLMLIGKVD